MWSRNLVLFKAAQMVLFDIGSEVLAVSNRLNKMLMAALFLGKGVKI